VLEQAFKNKNTTLLKNQLFMKSVNKIGWGRA
jgi:hypothetical protein